MLSDSRVVGDRYYFLSPLTPQILAAGSKAVTTLMDADVQMMGTGVSGCAYLATSVYKNVAEPMNQPIQAIVNAWPLVSGKYKTPK